MNYIFFCFIFGVISLIKGSSLCGVCFSKFVGGGMFKIGERLVRFCYLSIWGVRFGNLITVGFVAYEGDEVW